MKQKFLLLILLGSMLYTVAKANETEPNNTWNQANTLALNGTNNGDLNPTGDIDWWKVTTTGDGALNLSISSTDGRNIYFDLYDTLGVIALHTGTYTAGSANYTVDGLAKGTYYIKIYCYSGTDTGRYTISNTLTVPAQANDVEPDSTRGQAIVLPLNGSKTGHIGYYYHNHRDSVDWYKVTTNADGRLRLRITSNNGQNVYCELFDNNGVTGLNTGTYTSGTVDINTDGLAAGTYYLRIHTYFTTEFAPYTLADSLFTPTQAIDAEPDSTRAQALTLNLNSSTTGHIGYYYNNHRDSVDWYKVTTNADGRLRLTMTSANGQNVYAYLFDNNGTTPIANGYTAGSAVVVNVDGLAAGTYYIRVNTYFTTEFAPYTLADSLFSPTISNDTEPDSTQAQALILPLNGSKQGHIDYYYNNHRDSVDWYKVTTNADGRLRLTMTSANGQNVYAYLFDNNGITPIANGYTAGSAVVVNQDGLAAGTYYIRVNTYYPTEFAPYTISDSLFLPGIVNDAEPDSTKATALLLPLNGTVTGHTGYYYNNHRDTVDEYKLTTTADGNINLSLSIPNNTPVFFNLYDNDGNTVLHQDYTAGNDNYNVDGLSKGTYYVKVYCYYNTNFAPYTLKDTLYTYNPNDAEPNKYAKQAKTLNTNQAGNGHVDFYYNNVRDTVDWSKINYTGTGNMSVTLNVIPNITGPTQNTYMQVYKDTAVAPLYSNYTTTTETASLTGLAQGYYYVKIYEYYNGQFTAYTVTPTFTQVNIATIKATGYDTLATCDSLNSITFLPRGSHGPYTIQLFRFGTAYGSPVSTIKAYTFDSLPIGSYYAIAYGDGATGAAFGKSKTISIATMPTGLNTTNIQSTTARINWTSVPCASYFTIHYKVDGTDTWTIVKSKGNVTTYVLKNLTPNTTYDWEVASDDSANGIIATSAYADSIKFTTTASLIADGSEDNLSINTGKSIGVITIAPNPASSYFIIHYNTAVQQKLTATLYDVNGKPVWVSGSINADALNGKQVMVNQFGSGFYYLKITDEKGAVLGVAKVSITR